MFNNPLSFTDPSGYNCLGSNPYSRVYDAAGNEIPSYSMGAITTLCGQDAIDFGRDWQRQEDQNNWDYTTQNYQPSYYPDSMPFNSFNSTGIAAPIPGNSFAGAGCGIIGICLGDSVEDSADIGAAERVVGKNAMLAATVVGTIVGPGKFTKGVVGPGKFTKGVTGVPGRVQSRINLSNDGIAHTLSRHLNPARAGNKSQFTLRESELRSLLGAKSTVRAQVIALETGNFARTITANRTIGNLAEKMGGGSTNTFTVITDKFGNLQTAFPGGL